MKNQDKEIREKIIEILTEMMSTSAGRNWDLESRSTKQEITEMRNTLKNERLNCADQILSLISAQTQKAREELLKEIRDSFEDNGLEEQSLKNAKKCKLYFDHQPTWDGNFFTCGNCGIQFIPIKQVFRVLQSFRSKSK